MHTFRKPLFKKHIFDTKFSFWKCDNFEFYIYADNQ